MANIIKNIKIKKQDGTFTELIPLGTDANHVKYNNENLTNFLENLTNRINLLETENEKLFDQIPSNIVSGEMINITDSSDYPIQQFKLLGNIIQDIKYIYYKCVGNESGNYYFIYDNVNYQFTMPTITTGTLLKFNTITKKLYKDASTSSIATTQDNTGTLITFNNTPGSDYNVPINVVTGNNIIKFMKKNIFNPELLNQEEDYNTYDSTTGLWTTSNKNLFGRSILYDQASLNHNVNIQKVIRVNPNTTYTIKFYDLSSFDGASGMEIIFCDNVGVNISSLSNQTPPIITFTTPNDCYYIDICRRTSGGYYTFSKIQLEINSTSTEYESYIENTQTLSLGDIELVKVENYQDYIYKNNNKWYLHKEIFRPVITNWTQSDWGFTAETDITDILAPASNDDTSMIISNIYKKVTANNVYHLVGDVSEGMAITVDKKLIVRDTQYTDLDLFKNHVLNLVIYGVYNTPIDEEIIDEILIEQLENILNIATYKPITNLFISSIEMNATAEQWIKYKQDISTLIKN